MQVSLDIIKALIEKCHEDLNLFAIHIVKILTGVISSNDLALSQHASPVFESFCQFHDGALFTGDPAYVTDFQHLVTLYVKMAGTPTSGPNELDWKLVGLQAVNSLTASVAISTPVGKGHMESIIPLLLTCLSEDSDGSSLLSLDFQITGVESKHISRRMSVQKTTVVPENLTGEQQRLYTSMLALRHFFETTSVDLLKGATYNIVTFFLNHKSPSLWSATLLEIATSCAPVQIRFAVVTELVERLGSLPYTDTAHQLAISLLISSLLSSSVNMIGLSVIDILRSLLHTQIHVLRSADLSTLKPGNTVFELIVSLKDNVAALASHIYYGTQISDMISELLARCEIRKPRSDPSSGIVTPTSNYRIGQEISLKHDASNTELSAIFNVNALETISNILTISSVRIGGAEHSGISITCWNGSEGLLSHETMQVRRAYARSLIAFFEHHVSPAEKNMKITHDFNAVEGAFGRILVELVQLATNTSAKAEDYLIVYQVAFSFIQSLGDHGIVRAAALALLLENDSKVILSRESINEHTIDQGLSLSSIAYALIHKMGKKLDSDVLLSRIDDEIQHRQALGIWYSPINISQSLRESLRMNPYTQNIILNQENTSDIHPIDRSLVASALSSKIPDFELTMSHVIEADLTGKDGRAAFTAPHIPSDTSEAHTKVTRARSLKQLHQRLGVNANRMTPNFYYSNNNTNVSLLGASEANQPDAAEVIIVGDLPKPDVNLSSKPEMRRDFSPRVKDLKRAASGLSMRTNQPRIAQKEYAHSVKSTTSDLDTETYYANGQSTSPTSQPSSDAPRTQDSPKSDPLDVISFLSSLKIDQGRGRLV